LRNIPAFEGGVFFRIGFVWVWAGEFCIKTGIFFAMMARAVDNKIFIIFEEWGRLI